MFNVGDRVRKVQGNNVGRTGTVTQSVGAFSVRVQWDNTPEREPSAVKAFRLERINTPRGQRLTITAPAEVIDRAAWDRTYGGAADLSRLTLEGNFTFEVEDLESYVVVQTDGYSRLTYRDPSGTLVVGDRVLVPVGYKNLERFARVIELGRGSYSGPTKDVAARLKTEALA